MLCIIDSVWHEGCQATEEWQHYILDVKLKYPMYTVHNDKLRENLWLQSLKVKFTFFKWWWICWFIRGGERSQETCCIKENQTTSPLWREVRPLCGEPTLPVNHHCIEWPFVIKTFKSLTFRMHSDNFPPFSSESVLLLWCAPVCINNFLPIYSVIKLFYFMLESYAMLGLLSVSFLLSLCVFLIKD